MKQIFSDYCADNLVLTKILHLLQDTSMLPFNGKQVKVSQ